TAAEQGAVALSPDGNNALVVHLGRSKPQNPLWRRDLVHNGEIRIGPVDWRGFFTGTWSPDGSRIVTSGIGPSGPGVYALPLSGGSAELFLSSPGVIPSDWSRDGRYLVFTLKDPKTLADIWYLPFEYRKPGKPVKFLATDAEESQGKL